MAYDDKGCPMNRMLPKVRDVPKFYQHDVCHTRSEIKKMISRVVALTHNRAITTKDSNFSKSVERSVGLKIWWDQN